MGCGASVHTQGPEQEAATGASKDTSPVPFPEEKQAPAPEPDARDVEKPGGAQPAAGAPAPACAPDPSPGPRLKPEPAETQSLQPLCSAESGTPSSWADELSPCSPAPNGPVLLDGPASAPAAQPAQPQSLPGTSGGGTSLDGTRLVLGASTSCSSADVLDLERSNPNRSSGVFDPAVTPSSQTATVTLLPEAQGGFAGRARYTDESDLSIASHSYDLDGLGDDDSDDDEVASLFTLQSWKRYYNYNKRKSHDLLTYFWRRFPPQDFSCFCISYRNQELLVTSFMAENCIHGYCARLEDLGLASEVFLLMYTLHDPELDQYRIVGLLLTAGPALPPPLAQLSAFDGFLYHRADTSRTTVKQFVSALLVGVSPLHSLKLVSGREVL
ncbi:hypothetical protein PLESTB_000060400 [Pleodorina starrii]|uniref:EF-1-gamma C-terminal domain-containing protein n=1 Tax=Pleodorina starrii TaxID=330485 RepID=A0A9W6BAI4_9CHLO|nr:hypothetical protein PLESTM_001612600 [Pleodorina starrii]GLC48112.1 hypothetical protein PLESTB_000060400 [Pleodorina starrii]GLC67360.1 hypothetical protein PLESTF_000547700 [Pleodorina starrii]